MSSGITIRVTAETNAGGRRHMEDYISVNLSPSPGNAKNKPELSEQAFVGVFDGHGGKEAAKFAKEKMWEMIQKQPKFWTTDVDCVREAISDAFLALHRQMIPYRSSWKRNKTGDLSTAGTTACTVIFRKDHIFVGNCGDSSAVLAIRNPNSCQPGVIAQVLTKDHKPEDPSEQEAIEKRGGKVLKSPKGVMRVVWAREKVNTATGQKSTDFIPFLSVSRSLGDFWSYNPTTEQYTVSPKPDVFVLPMDLSRQSFVILASDGLWNVMSPTDAVTFIHSYEQKNHNKSNDMVGALIKEALRRWESRKLQADNISVLVAFLSKGDVNSQVSAPDGSVSSSKSSLSTVDSIASMKLDTAQSVAVNNSEIISSSLSTSTALKSISSSSSKQVFLRNKKCFQPRSSIRLRQTRKLRKPCAVQSGLTRRALYESPSSSTYLSDDFTSSFTYKSCTGKRSLSSPCQPIHGPKKRRLLNIVPLPTHALTGCTPPIDVTCVDDAGTTCISSTQYHSHRLRRASL